MSTEIPVANDDVHRDSRSASEALELRVKRRLVCQDPHGDA